MALVVIEKLMYEADKDSVRLSAATFIIERAFGKTTERIEPPGSLEEWRIEDLLAVRDELRQRIAAKGLLNGALSLPALR